MGINKVKVTGFRIEDESILKVACSFNRTGKTPTYRQSKRLLEIKSRIELEGYVNEI